MHGERRSPTRGIYRTGAAVRAGSECPRLRTATIRTHPAQLVMIRPSRHFSVTDVVAGASVALLLIPQALAYAELAGVPAHLGLYAAVAAPVAASLLASSPYLQTGPVALTALLTLGALSPMAAPGSAAYVEMAVLLALVVGAVRLAVGAVGAGIVAFLLSSPVLMGFTSGAAILIVASQLPGALGVTDLPGAGVMGQAGMALADPSAWQPAAVVLSVATVAVIHGSRRLHPLFPGVLLATVGGIVYSAAAGYSGPTLGTFPAGLPTPSLALPWMRLPDLLIPGVVIALVGFAEPASIARTFAIQDRQPWDPNREFMGQGLANLASGLVGAFPVGGSFSRSGINRMAGARTRWSGAVTGLFVLAFLPFAAVLAPLPRATLSAIVIAAVFGLVKVSRLAAMFRQSRLQALVGGTTLALTLFLSPRVDLAVLLGVVMALGVHAWREMQPRLHSWIEGETLHIRPEGVLWFGSAPLLEEKAFALLYRDDGTTCMVFHLQSLGRIDFTGALGLRELVRDAEAAGVKVEFREVPEHARRILKRVLGWEPPPSPSEESPS